MAEILKVAFACPACNAPLRAGKQQLDRRWKCPACTQVISIPENAKPSAEGDDWWAIDLPDDGSGFFPENVPPSDPIEPPRETAPRKPTSPKPVPRVSTSPRDSSLKSSAMTDKDSVKASTVTGQRSAGASAPRREGSPAPKVMLDIPSLNPSTVQSTVPVKAKTPQPKPGSAEELFPELDSLVPVVGTDLSFGLDDLPPLPTTTAVPALGSFRTTMDDDPLSAGDLQGETRTIDLPHSTSPDSYNLRCLRCGSQIGVRATQAGKQVRCPDCHTVFIAPPPPTAKKVVLQTRTQGLLESDLPPPTPQKDIRGKTAEDYLRAAEAAPLLREENAQYDMPDVTGWSKQIFGMFRDGGVLIHLFGLTLFSLVMSFVASIDGDAKILALMCGVLATGGILIASLSCGIAILEATSNGHRRVESWPSTDPTEWFMQLLLVLGAFSMSATPGFLLGMLLGVPMIKVALTLLCLFAFFPVVLLSMLDNQSVFQPVSGNVIKSVGRAPDAWFTFFMTSGCLLFLLFVVLIMASFLDSGSPIPHLVIYLGITLTVFFYMRMLGRLGGQIGKVINDQEDPS